MERISNYEITKRRNSDEEFEEQLQIFMDKNILDFIRYEAVWYAVAHELCDIPEISAELSNLWNTLVYGEDTLVGQEDVLASQLKDILERCQ